MNTFSSSISVCKSLVSFTVRRISLVHRPATLHFPIQIQILINIVYI